MVGLTPFFENGSEVINHFFEMSRDTNKDRVLDRMRAGFYITSKIRREIMTSLAQGRVMMFGRYYKIEFKSMGGGVWRVFINLTATL